MLEKFERYPLTFGPTPIEKLSRLSEHLAGNVKIYAKREDCNSGLATRPTPGAIGLHALVGQPEAFGRWAGLVEDVDRHAAARVCSRGAH